MLKFNKYNNEHGYTIYWGPREIGLITYNGRSGHYKVSSPKLNPAYFDTELEALEYIIELIKVSHNE